MEAEGRGYFVWTSVFAEEEKNQWIIKIILFFPSIFESEDQCGPLICLARAV
jgi:hypothetical protein